MMAIWAGIGLSIVGGIVLAIWQGLGGRVSGTFSNIASGLINLGTSTVEEASGPAFRGEL